ncbi:MAG TPA: FMN-binding negative transcriptional regulator, partial [Bryobacteraceae bacterium]|nr:FMN-binding negative transcriptional regulator [Bryobacteraceae bacterium]
HRYISPSWYKSELAVPTWNFATVHVSGRPRRIEDAKMFRDFLGRLVARNESYEDKPWDFGKLPEGYKAGTQSGAVMFEMPIERLEAKFKLGAERTEADRQGVLAGLKKAKPERTMFELTEDWYRRHPKK